MRSNRHRNKLLIEPPSSATGDIAFNLIVFFLVCASVQPEEGIRLQVPSSEKVETKQQQSEHVEIILTSNTVVVNSVPVPIGDLQAVIEDRLKDKTSDDQRVVVLKTQDRNTPYQRWAQVVSAVKRAKGVITLQIEEERIEYVQ